MRRGRWSLGVVVAIVVAIAAAMGGHHQTAPARHAAAPTHVALTLEPDGVSLRVAHDALAVTFKF